MCDPEKFEIISRGIKNILIGASALITAWFGTSAVKDYANYLQQNVNVNSSANSSSNSTNNSVVNCNAVIQKALSQNLNEPEKLKAIIQTIPEKQFAETGATKGRSEILKQLESKQTVDLKLQYLKDEMPALEFGNAEYNPRSGQ